MAGVLLVVGSAVIVVVLDRRSSAQTSLPMPALHSCGRSTNPIVTEVFLLTNSTPAAVEYTAIQEWGGGTASYTNSHLTNGILQGHSVVRFQIPLSERSTRLSISCFSHRPLRDLADEVRNMFGLAVKPRVSHYAVFSEELRK